MNLMYLPAAERTCTSYGPHACSYAFATSSETARAPSLTTSPDSRGSRGAPRRSGSRSTSSGARSATGIPYLAPEVQLFYKAKATRDKDETDFEAVLPLLDAPARAWLADAIKVIAPTHHWLRRLLPLSRT
ncbi:hypothetical protein ACIQMR_18895 [Streptomyces sp. NPDC091376]|uniref:hypothetical protein n=1 Tax=Streptomyces sp. NPDC091376 TaxID=3365994 RepID=UPI003814E319